MEKLTLATATATEIDEALGEKDLACRFHARSQLWRSRREVPYALEYKLSNLT